MKPTMQRLKRRTADVVLKRAVRFVEPSALAWHAVRATNESEKAAAEVIRRLSDLVPPTGADVVANYLRGRVVLGRSGEFGAAFEWLSPPQRAVITPDTAHVPQRVRTYQRRREFEVHFDKDLDEVIQACREGRDSWITPPLVEVYQDVHELGLISTISAYRDGVLAGGMWGIALGRVFGVMSMFHRENRAGAVAFAAVVDELVAGNRWSMIDCGTMKEHFGRFGAVEIPRERFTATVMRGLAKPRAPQPDEPSPDRSPRTEQT